MTINELSNFFRNVILQRILALTQILAFIIPTIFLISQNQVSYASYLQNDNQGYFQIDFNGNGQGFAPVGPLRAGVVHDSIAGIIKRDSASTTGYFYTSDITPNSFSDWTKVQIQGGYNNLNDIKVSAYTCGSSPAPISAVQNVAINSSGEVDLAPLSNADQCIRLRIDFDSNGSIIPSITDLKIRWSPLPVFLISESAQATAQVGETINYSISYSVSYVDDAGVVLWDELPTVANGGVTNFDPSYSQTLTPTFVEASNGGLYTSSAITVNGISIPANSVYWNLGNVTAGQTGTLSYKLGTSNGWQNGIKINNFVKIDSLAGDIKISDSDIVTAGNQPLVTTLTSSPSPTISKTASGVIDLGGVKYVYSGGSYTPVITYTISKSQTANSNSAAPVGRETIFNPHYEDDLTDIWNKLISSCSVSDPSTRISINDGGVLDSGTKKITWPTASNIAPGADYTVTYTVDYTGCTDSTVFNNTATLYGSNTSPISDGESVKIGLDTTPVGVFAKGDTVYGSTQITSGQDDNFGPAAINNGVQSANDVFDYNLFARNPSTVRLGNIIMVDKIDPGLEFISMSLPSGASTTLWYNVNGSSTSANTPEDFNTATGVFGSTWTTTPPSNPADVVWVAAQTECLNSNIFPVPVGQGCEGVANSINVPVKVKIKPDADVCRAYDLTNISNFFAFSAATNISNNDADVAVLASPLSYSDTELTHVGPTLATFSNGGFIVSGPDTIDAGSNASYVINATNKGNDTAQNVVVTINIPQVNVNGVLTNLTYVNALGGVVDTSSLPNSVSINLANIPSGQSKSVTLTLGVPNGVLNANTYQVSASIEAGDDNNCAPINSSSNKTTSVVSRPKISIYKERDESVITTSAAVHYKINYNNIGSSPTTETYIIDRIPDYTVFDKAYTTGTDANGNTFTCNGCTVLFSQSVPVLPPGVSPFSAFTVPMINSNFTLGIEGPAGVWTSPFGVGTSWVAYRLDDPALSTVLNPTGDMGAVGLTVINDDDQGGPGTAGSPSGTILRNQAAIFSSELLQAIGNQVTTTILPDPGLKLHKTSDKDQLVAGETFNWNIDYANDSGNDDTSVIIKDTLPIGVNLLGVYHTWNNKAITNGASPSGELDLSGNSNVTMATNTNGTVDVTVNITNLRAGDLKNLEGGRVRFNVSVLPSITSGTTLVNNAEGCYSNPAAAYCITDEDPVTVINPDLYIAKSVDKTDPLPGEYLLYTLVVANRGAHFATDVFIKDTLPAGVCYSPGTTAVITPTGWSLPEPVVTGTCLAGQTLTWTNVITGPSTTTPGYMPGNSGDVYIRYATQLDATLPPGVSLTNGASIGTPLTEDTVYQNQDSQTVQTPYPDPYILKSATPIVDPGENITYTLRYGNAARIAGSGIYFVDSLPDIDGDGDADVDFLNIAGANGETFYYHAGPIATTSPSFDFNNPLSNGWASTSSLVSPVGYVAVSVGNVAANAGPFTVTMTTKAKDPVANINLAPGTVLVNTATIYASGTDATSTNNTSRATTTVPSLDLAVEKTADIAGSFPGTTPGSNITYTIKVKNPGTVDACAVYVEDILPLYASAMSPIHNFNSVSLISTISGTTVQAHDPLGNNISSAINTTFTQAGQTLRWNLGSLGTTPYQNVCMPPKTELSFQIYAKISSSAPDSSVVTNSVRVGEDSPANEDLMTNNTANTSVTVYRTDVVVQKNGISYGPDGILGTSDDSQTYVNPGEKINYTINYNNIGNTNANDVVINENIPTGTCYVNGSVAIPAGSVLELSNNGGASWTYTSASALGSPDCAVTNFRIKFTSPLPAPATFDSEDLDADFLSPDPAKAGNTKVLVHDDSVSMSGSASAGLSVPYVYNYSIPTTTWTPVAMASDCWNISVTPHPICSIDDLAQVDDNPSWSGDSFILMNDLDMTGVTWDPLFNGMGYDFTGDFNGNDRKISNLTDFVFYSNNMGLFGLTNGGHIYNLNLDNIVMNNNSSVAGLLVGDAKDTHIENIRLENSSITSSDTAGGVIGRYENTNGSGELNEIYISGTNVSVPSAKLAGGLVGYIYGPGSPLIIKNVYVDGGSVTGHDLVGGLVGGTDGSLTISGSYTSNTIMSESNGFGFGGLIGRAGPNVEISNSYSSSNINLDNGGQSTGGLVGHVGGGDSSINSSYFNGVISGIALGNPSYQTGGLIGLLKYGSSPYNIDNSYSNTNITLPSGSQDTGGLVGNIADSNFRSDGSISIGSVSGGNNIGGIVGYMSGTGSTFKGAETSMTVNGESQVGGFVGVMDNDSRIIYGGAMGDVTANGDIVGGFAGVMAGTSYVDQAYSKGNVTSSNGNLVGGFVGLMKNENNKITYAHADGNVVADNTTSGYGQNVGGFVGRTMGEIHEAYARGSVTGSDYVGGFAGSIEDNGSIIAREFSTFALNIGGVHSAAGAGGCNGWHTGSAMNSARVEGYGYNMTTGDPVGPFGDPANGCINIVPIDDYAYTNAPESQFYSSGEVFYSNPTQPWDINGGTWQNDSDTVLPYFPWETKSSSGIIGNSYYYTTVNANPVGFLGWDKLFINSTVPTPGTLTEMYVEVMTPDCTSLTFSGTLPLTNSGLLWEPNNVGGIDNYSSICLRFIMQSDDTITSPSLDGWKFSYKSSINPSFTWDAQVINSPLTPSQINNTVNIMTSTPESNVLNNIATDTLYLIQSDLELHKYVDKAAMDITEVNNGDEVTYTIVIKNNGPNTAVGTYVIDQLPSYLKLPLSSISTVTSVGTLACTVNSITYVMYCDDDGLDSSSSTLNMSITDTATITIKSTINPGAVSVGDQLVNNAKVYSSTFDTNTDNNENSVSTVIGGFANVYVTKTGPTKANVGKDYTWTINFGNNGNIGATNTYIIDKLPNEDINDNGILDPGEDIIPNGVIDKYFTFVNGSGTIPLAINCGVYSDTATATYVICNMSGSATDTDWTLAPGDVGSLNLTATAVNDYSLLNGGTSTNRIYIQTNTDETNIADNTYVHTVPFWPLGYSTISGHVYYDANADNIRSATETPIANVNTFLVGANSSGKFILPDQTLYPIEYSRAIAVLTAAGYTVSTSSILVLPPVLTDALGAYIFSGLLPGKYFVLEQQPNAYVSTGSNAGYLMTDASGTPIFNMSVDGKGSFEDSGVSVNEVLGIVLGESQNSQENNFGEIGGSIGNQVFYDLNEDGTYDASDTPISNIIVELVNDVNGNGISDAGESVSITMTNASGTYMFDHLALSKYIVRINPMVYNNSILATGYTYSAGAVGSNADGVSKLYSGYAVSLSTTTNSNMTADFGFRPTHPELSIVKSGAGAALVGGVVNYTLDVKQIGHTSQMLYSGDVVKVMDTLPAGLTFISATGTGWTCGVTGQNVNCDYLVSATMTPTSTLPTIGISTSVDYSATGTLTNTAYVNTSREYVITGGNGTSVLNTSNLPTGDNVSTSSTAIIPISLGAIGNQVFGDTNGDGSYQSGIDTGLGGVAVTLYLDANTDGILNSGDTIFSSTTTDSTGNYMFNFLPIKSYIVAYSTSSVSLNNYSHIAGPLLGTDNNSQYNYYSVTLSTSSPAEQINTTSDFGFILNPDLIITKTVATSTLYIGQAANFILQVSTNPLYGSSYNSVTVSDILPSGLIFTGATGTDWSCNAVVTCTYTGSYPILASTTLPSITVSAIASATGTIVNTGTVSYVSSATSTEVSISNNTATATVSVLPLPPIIAPDLQITKSGPALYATGATAVYDLVISNTGSGPATNTIHVTDILPSGMTLGNVGGVSWDCSSSTTTIVSCDYAGIYPVAVGSSLPIINILVNISDTATGVIVNSATVSTISEATSTQGNNIAYATSTPTTTVPVSGTSTPTSTPTTTTNTAVIGNQIFSDNNNDGVYNGTDTPIAGVIVALYNNLGVNVGTVTTNLSGQYWFTNLPYGVYTVRVPSQAGLTDTVNTLGVFGADNNSQPSSGYTISVGTSSPINTSADFGFRYILGAPILGSIGNQVFNDINGNGVYDVGDSAISGVVLELRDSIGSIIATTTTDILGSYLFTSLPLGNYSVTVLNSSIPTNLSQTFGITGLDNNSQHTGALVVLSNANPNINYLDFGYKANSVIITSTTTPPGPLCGSCGCGICLPPVFTPTTTSATTTTQTTKVVKVVKKKLAKTGSNMTQVLVMVTIILLALRVVYTSTKRREDSK